MILSNHIAIGLMLEVKLGKMLQTEKNAQNDLLRPYLRAAHIQPGGQLDLNVDMKEMWFSDREVRELDLRPGDGVIVEGGAGFGRAAYLENGLDGWGFQNSIIRLRGLPANVRYAVYALGAALEAGEIALACNAATFAHFTAEKVQRFRIPFHGAEEHARIVDYLDRETGEIDAMLAKLDELREQLIQRRLAAVDNEFSCVGTSSKVRLPFVADVIPGLTYSPSDIVDSGGVVVHRAGSVQNSRIDRSDLVRVSTSIPAKLCIQPGDILVCTRNGSAHLVGKCAIVGISEIGETWGAFMTVLRSQHYRYIYWYMQSSLFAQERKQYFTSTINQLTVGMFSRMMIPFPESHVQERIADHLDEVTGRIDAMLAKIDELRALLVERRAALITDVVTGRKKVPA